MSEHAIRFIEAKVHELENAMRAVIEKHHDLLHGAVLGPWTDCNEPECRRVRGLLKDKI